MKKNFVQRKVIVHFKSAETYRKRNVIDEKVFHSNLSNFIQNYILNMDSKILEVGGGSGYLLAYIIKNTMIKEAYNLELVYEIHRRQAN